MSDPTDEAEEAAGATGGFRIVRGGTPGAEELAAIAVALTPVALAAPVADGTGAAEPSPWRTAALLEGSGAARFLTPGDLVRRNLGSRPPR